MTQVMARGRLDIEVADSLEPKILIETARALNACRPESNRANLSMARSMSPLVAR